MNDNKALIVGINSYPNANLSFCVNDAEEIKELLSKNEDGTPNFSVKMLSRDFDTPSKE